MAHRNTDVSDLPGLWEFPGYGMRLTYDAEEVADESQVCDIALRAIFGGPNAFFRPLSLGLTPAYWDYECDYPLRTSLPGPPARAMWRADLPGDVRVWTTWVGEEVHLVDELNYESARRFVRAALEPDGSGLPIGWDVMEVRASTVRLPAGSEFNTDGSISVRDRIWALDYPVESVSGTHWVSGPQAGVLEPPIGIRICRDFFELTLDIAVYWYLWVPRSVVGARGGQGYPELRDWIRTLLAAGWTWDQDAGVPSA
ncbi:hypothetical protein [Nocardia sp. IFM 10818]